MAESRIGKYRILERIGRGGMGMIFRAHDPVLDRQVAVKVIAAEGEVTDEMRTRFFREAQACARLNHPNIVTVYDMGEDDGRLFIVMELLEGQELRRFITPEGGLTLEDKLAAMVQVCTGLHYAHQKGIIHRDIKPGNIFLLRNGLVKLLDFGIAHMASGDGLTRTGLIMGTLRYISPEQVRGRADHRSDMFSLGSVCYELLALRPPFTGEDPMHLLEQLRTDDPPPLSEVDPSIPPALAGIVQRAMRKNPAERFNDLDEMRAELEQVQRTMGEERQRASARVRAQRERIARLQADLPERVGKSVRDAEIPGIDARMGLVAIEALERDLEARITALEAEIAEAQALSPAVQHAEALMMAGRYEEAIAQFEAVVAEIPDLRRAQEGLALARAEVDAQHRRRRGTDLLDKARAALREQRYGPCVELVTEALDTGLPADLTQELTALREQALAEQEAVERERHAAEEAAQRCAAARTAAEAEDAPRYALGKWNEAQALVMAAEANLRRGAHADAKDAFDRALATYGNALDASRQAQVEEGRAAEQAREAAILGQRQAQAAGAEQYAGEVWAAAERKFAEARETLTKSGSGRGAATFREAAGLYRQAEEAARVARDRERRRAEAARERNTEAQRSAEALGAERLAGPRWQEAVARTTAGEAAWVRHQYATAAEAFEGALRLHHQAQAESREAVRRQREETARRQAAVDIARQAAQAEDAAVNASSEWSAAEASSGAAAAALERTDWEEAFAGFDRAAELYRAAETRARAVQQTRSEAGKAEAASRDARGTATATEAARHAPKVWEAAQSAETRALTAFGQQRYTSARALFGESERLYTEARTLAASAIAEAAASLAAGEATVVTPVPPPSPTAKPRTEPLKETIAVDPSATLEGVRGIGQDETVVIDRTPRPSGDPTVLVSPGGTETVVAPSPEDGGGGPRTLTLLRRPSLRTVLIGAGAIAAVVIGVLVWSLRPAPPPPVVVTPPTPLERLVSEVQAAREEAIRVGAETLAPTRFNVAGEKAAGARKERDPAVADKRYREALTEYKLAALAATGVAAQKKDLEKAERRVADARQAADRAGAPRLAAAAWKKGTDAQAKADEALKQQTYDRALTLFGDAQQAFEDAARDAGGTGIVVSGQPPREKRERDEADEARRVALEARREADQAKAGSFARQIYAVAQAKEADGETALKGQQFASARQRFVEAQDAFKRAAQDAQAAAAQAAAAEKAREETAAREREAAAAAREREAAAARDREAAAARERAAAGEREAAATREREAAAVREREAAASREREAAAAREREATAARERQAAAAREAVAAREREAAAAREREAAAARERVQVAARQGVEQSRTRMLARREDAVKVEAGRWAKNVFDAADKKQAEADALAKGQNLSDAGHRYGDAADLYLEAKMRAESITEAKKQADNAKARMLVEKQRANQGAPEYSEAQSEERQANALYERSSFNEAADKYRSTAMLYARALKPPPAPPPPPRRQVPPSF